MFRRPAPPLNIYQPCRRKLETVPLKLKKMGFCSVKNLVFYTFLLPNQPGMVIMMIFVTVVVVIVVVAITIITIITITIISQSVLNGL